jgi:SAM-dependent methyltransferase
MGLPQQLGIFLDYGCGKGELMQLVCDRCQECHGVDVDPGGIRDLERQYPQMHFAPIPLSGETPYPPDTFDTIVISEVIEHVPDERATLGELQRILKPGGRLFLTTRHKGLLTFIDVGNLKFVFPRLYRLVRRLWYRGGPDRSGPAPVQGDLRLVGDVTVSPHRRPWHRHYRPREIEAFAGPQLVVEQANVYFPGERLFTFLRLLMQICTLKRVTQFLPPPLPMLEKRLSRMSTSLGDELVMTFRKG